MAERTTSPRGAHDSWSEVDLAAVEEAHPEGMTVQQIVEIFAGRGQRLTEATFRKYVQLGLLPRSIRVARKGRRRGSQGMYPASVVRQIDEIRRLMGQGYTMDEIQREFLFIRGDLEALTRSLDRVYSAVERVIAERESESEGGADELVTHDLVEARELGRQLVGRLEAIEKRMSMRARMARAAV